MIMIMSVSLVSLCRYVDFPVTDVLQMIGRAGRPQYDDEGVACVLVHEPKKHFYKKFLHEPFPVESCLHMDQHLHHLLMAEVSASSLSLSSASSTSASASSSRVRCLADCIECISYTYFFRRLSANPSYYGLTMMTPESSSASSSSSGHDVTSMVSSISAYLRELITRVLRELSDSKCIMLMDANVFERSGDIMMTMPTTYGVLASRYYVDHRSMRRLLSTLPMFERSLHHHDHHGHHRDGVGAVAGLLCSTAMEFSELPVRHNEEHLNAELSASLPWPVSGYIPSHLLPEDGGDADADAVFKSAHVKAYLLLQALITRTPLPIADYVNDTKSMMDQLPRVMACVVDVCCHDGHLRSLIMLSRLAQCIAQVVNW